MSSSQSAVVIEKEVATGWVFYVLRVGDTDCYSSENLAPLPHRYTDPVQTKDLLNKKTYLTTKNPAYEDITIVPGLKLEYPVFDGENPEPIANMTVTINSEPFGSAAYEYIITDADNANPRVSIDTATKTPIDPAVLDCLPINDITVSVYPDESFTYDARSIVEERYVVSISEKHQQWLHHVFHALILHCSV